MNICMLSSPFNNKLDEINEFIALYKLISNLFKNNCY